MRWLTLPLALSGLLLLAACPCDRGQPEVFHEDFESWCEGLPCGWERAAGRVERTTSYHAGEHGAELSGGARLGLDLDGVLLTADRDQDEDQLVFMIRCDAEAGLRFTLEVEGEEGPFLLEVESPLGAGISSEIIQMQSLPLPAREGETPPAQAALRLELEQFGQGACFIDELRILSGEYVRCMG